MKRIWGLLLVLVLGLMFSVINVKAAQYGIIPECHDDGNKSIGGIETCEIYYTADVVRNYNAIKVSADIKGLEFESNQDESGWEFIDNKDGTFTFKYNKQSLPTGKVKITTLKYKRTEVDCHLKLSVVDWLLEKNICKQVDGTYYGKSGNSVSADQFDLECNEHKCEEVQGHYFGPNGDTITESQYKVDCDHVKCEKLPDGRFVDKSGLIVPYIDYRKSCETIKCEVLPDGTRYDNEGNIVEEDEFRESCGDVCYQDSEGKYHGKTGEEVDSVTYQKECGNNVCQAYSDGTYSDPEGKETTKEDYELKCKKHVCEKIGDNYFDDKGNPVTKEQFNKACPAGEIPKTGVSLPIISILVLSASGILLLFASKKSNKFMD